MANAIIHEILLKIQYRWRKFVSVPHDNCSMGIPRRVAGDKTPLVQESEARWHRY